MGRRRNKKKKANKQMDPQQRIDFSSGSRIQDDYKNLSQKEKFDEEYDEKTTSSTTENEAASTAGPIICETLHRMENIDGGKDPIKSCVSPTRFKSEKRFPSKNFDNFLIEEPKCIGFYEHEVENNHNKLTSPEWWNKPSCDRLDNCTYERHPARNPRKCFAEVLNRWLPVRDRSIRKLRRLLDKVTENEAAYDNLELDLKYGSEYCKKGKVVSPPSFSWESLYSVGSFFCDLAGGLTSVSHMINTDCMQKEFQETMDEDANATKEMYEARSRYITEYRYTEEIIRKFDGTTLGETLGKISETVGITEFFQKMEKAKNNNEDLVTSAITALDTIMTRNCNRNVGREVADALQELVDTNPACVGAATGVGKSLYGAGDLLVKSRTTTIMSRALVTAGTKRLDLELLKQEQSDIRELERKIKGGSKTTLGSRIQEALDMFEEEKNEMLELFSKL